MRSTLLVHIVGGALGILSGFVAALTTVRPVAVGSRWVNATGVLVALGVGVASLAFAVDAIAQGGKRHGIPAFPFVLFGVVGLLASAGDVPVMRSGPLRGASRLARHLWRMCFALFIASLSFFIGQAKVFPKSIRIPGLLALPVLCVLATMLYWLWRIRFKQSLRGIVTARDATGRMSTARRNSPAILSVPLP